MDLLRDDLSTSYISRNGDVSLISVSIDSNEQSHPRANDLLAAMAGDDRFSFQGYRELPVDVVFSKIENDPIHGCGENLCNCIENKLYVELKEVDDYLASIFSGHLYQQTLLARESGHPSMVLVLGSDEDISSEIENNTFYRKTKLSKKDQIAFEISSVRRFEANCIAHGIIIQRWKKSPYTRLLSTADKILNGSSLMPFRPKPSNGERDIAAASMLLEGIGPALAKTILSEYDLCFCPKANARPLTSLPGIGKKRALQIFERVRC